VLCCCCCAVLCRVLLLSPLSSPQSPLLSSSSPLLFLRWTCAGPVWWCGVVSYRCSTLLWWDIFSVLNSANYKVDLKYGGQALGCNAQATTPVTVLLLTALLKSLLKYCGLPGQLRDCRAGNSGMGVPVQAPAPAAGCGRCGEACRKLSHAPEFLAHRSPSRVFMASACPLTHGIMRACNQDIIGLQECNHFEQNWRPALQERGFDALHVPKNNGPAARFGAPADGVALCVVICYSLCCPCQQPPFCGHADIVCAVCMPSPDPPHLSVVSLSHFFLGIVTQFLPFQPLHGGHQQRHRAWRGTGAAAASPRRPWYRGAS